MEYKSSNISQYRINLVNDKPKCPVHLVLHAEEDNNYHLAALKFKVPL